MNDTRLCLTRRSARGIRAAACIFLLCIMAAACSGPTAVAQTEVPPGPSLSLTPQTLAPNVTVPGLYTWYSNLGIVSKGWGKGETVNFHLYGPLNTLGVTPDDNLIGYAVADDSGNLAQFYTYIFNNPVKTDNLDLWENIPIYPTSLTEFLPEGYVPRPGKYELRAMGTAAPPHLPPGEFPPPDSAVADIVICPDTVSIPSIPASTLLTGWSQFRGARDGFLGSNSPERADPEWLSVWSKTPVALYATIPSTDSTLGISDPPANQPSFISHADLPFTHYGHDVNMELIPDPDYLWTVATANYISETKAGKANYGTIECEWETQNNGNPFTYGTGDIGMPIWVMPTPGDRVYMVGRWVMDNGHPDGGDRTEIHPVRLLATMRKQNTAVPFLGSVYMTRASRVDIYVSGHGGGSNQYPDGLDDALERGGAGGGILQSTGLYLPNYYAFGPSTGDAVQTFIAAYKFLNGDVNVQAEAGPLADNWTGGPEERPIKDMDYDFDVPLPPAPPGATAPEVIVTTHPTDEPTTVQEQITYINPNPSTGLPTAAHIHLPYKDSDSHIYAKTLEFYWNAFSTPGEHFRVQMDNITFFLAQVWSGECQMWTDICGQWQYLTAVDPHGFLNATATLRGYLANLPPTDVYLDPSDKLRVFTMGYDQEAFDGLFGTIIDQPPPHPQLTSYQAGLPLAVLTGENDIRQKIDSNYAVENVNLGGAVFEGLPSAQPDFGTVGGHIIDADGARFYEQFHVNFVPSPPRMDVSGAPVDYGGVCVHSSQFRAIPINNLGESALFISQATVSGGGYTIISDLPIVVGNMPIPIKVIFSPTDPSQGAGVLTLTTNDPGKPTFNIPLTATVLYPTINVTSTGTLFPPTVVGCSNSETVKVSNTGTCDLVATPILTGSGYSLAPYPQGEGGIIIVSPGSSQTLTVNFSPSVIAQAIPGTLTFRSDDPNHRTTSLSFCGEGVSNGVRVLVVQSDGTPYPVVDRIRVTGGPPNSSGTLTNVPLTTVGPPLSCQTIQYHADIALPPNTTTGTTGGTYKLTVRIRHKPKAVVTFTLGSCQFRPITVTVP